MDNSVLLEIEGHVAHIRLNGERSRNSLSPECLLALDTTFVSALANTDVRVIVLSSTRAEHFCVGADLKQTIPLMTGAREPQSATESQILEWLQSDQKPQPLRGERSKQVIAAVSGVAFGAGLELALAADIVIASEDALFKAPEVALGVYPV